MAIFIACSRKTLKLFRATSCTAMLLDANDHSLELRPSFQLVKRTMEDGGSRAMRVLLCFTLVFNASLGYKHIIVMHGMLGAPGEFDSFLTILQKVRW